MLQPLRVALCLPLGAFTRELKTYQKTRAELKMVTFFREQLGNIYQFFFKCIFSLSYFMLLRWYNHYYILASVLQNII